MFLLPLNIFTVTAATFIFPTTILPWGMYLQKDAVSTHPKTEKSLRAKIAELAQRMGFTKPITLTIVNESLSGAEARGNNLLPGRAGLIIDPSAFYNLSEGEREFILAHELSHIKNNDLLTIPLMSMAASYIATIALCILFPVAIGATPLVMVAFLVCTVAAFVIVSRWREKEADLTAFSFCSEEGKKGSIEFFKNVRDYQIELRNDKNVSFLTSLWRKLQFSENGDMRLDIFHPSISARINYLTNQYKSNSNNLDSIPPLLKT